MQKRVGADTPQAAKRRHDNRRREAERDGTRAAQMAFPRASGAAGTRTVVLVLLQRLAGEG